MTQHEVLPTPQEPSIEALLPRYYETHNTNLQYTVRESMTVDGHEVAWMQYTGSVVYDITGQGKEGQVFSGHALYCACHFTENVGWRIDPKYGVVGLSGKEGCDKKQAVVQLRHQQLREEYQSRGLLGEDSSDVSDAQVEAVILDLMQKGANEEFLEGSTGASSWGGYFYLQTVESITGRGMGTLWDVVDTMIEHEQLDIEGAVVQPWRPRPEPSWQHYVDYEHEGWKVTAGAPTHSKMPQVWKLDLLGPAGVDLELSVTAPLYYNPEFGIDVEDEQNAQRLMRELVNIAITKSTELKNN